MSVKRKNGLPFILVTLVIDFIGFGIIIPVFPKLLEELTGGNLSQAAVFGGWLTSAYALAQFCFAPVLGGLSDKYGRRPVLLLALLSLGIDYLFLAFTPNLTWLFVGRIVAGIAGASYSPATAFIADISEPEKKAANFGLVGACFGIGFIIGPVLGGILGSYGARVPFLAAAGLSLLNSLYGYFVLPESLLPENRRTFEWKRANPIGTFHNASKYAGVMPLMAVLLIYAISHHASESTWTFFTMERFNWDTKMVGYSLGVVGVMIAIVQGFLIRIIIPRLGEVKTAYLAFAMAIVSNVLIGFSTQSWMVMVLLIPYTFSFLGNSALQGYISNQVPDNAQGELQGVIAGMQSLSSIFGPLLMTELFSYFTSKHSPVYLPGVPFITAAVLATVCLLVSLRTLGSKTTNTA